MPPGIDAPDASGELATTHANPDQAEAHISPQVGHSIEQHLPHLFADFPIDTRVKHALAQMGYEAPTEVQSHVIGPAAAGSDLLVQSKTGSGKTTAFGIPVINRILDHHSDPQKPAALILTPTRELASQVARELERLGQVTKTRVLAIYGGMPMGKQVTDLARGVDVVVATPGRLLDHLRRGNLNLSSLEVVVLDEADEMLSMGFWEDVTEIIKLTPKKRQTLLFSATLPYQVVKTAAHLLSHPVRVDLSGDDLNVDGIDNCILHVLPDLPKPRQMLYVLEGARADSAIIFCNTRNETEMLAKYLTQLGFVAEPLSGNFKQKERDKTMARIKGGELRYMVATDIAARGIDINDLSHVFNYSLPEFCEVYLHRVGRTGRQGKVGRAISLVDGKGLGTLSVLERDFGVKFTEMTLPPEGEVILARSQRIMKELADKAAVAELGQHLPVAQNLLADKSAAQVVAFLLKSYFGQQAAQMRAGSEPLAAFAERDQTPASASELSPTVTNEGPLGDEDDDGSGEPGRRRRRRRRSRRRGEGEGEAESGGLQADPDDDLQPIKAGSFEIIDASELLGGAPTRPAPVESRAPNERRPRRERQSRPERQEGRSERQPRGDRQDNRAQRQDRPERGNRRRDPNAHHHPGGGGRGDSQPWASPRPQPALSGDDDDRGNVALPRRPSAPPPPPPPAPEGFAHIRVNIGFDDGFKGRGAVAKRIAALAGLNEGTISEVESRRDYAILRATPETAELVVDRVDGAQLGKKVIVVQLG